MRLLKAVLHFENWYARAAEWLRLLPRRPYALRLRHGPTFWVRPYTSDAAFVQMITREQEYFPYFNVLPGDVVVDVGANIGSFAVLVGWMQPTARVIAYEPVPDNVELLKKNIAANSLANVVAVPAAVAERSGTMSLFPGRGTWHGSGSLESGPDVRGDAPIMVPAVTLDDVFKTNSITHCDFLKMDCEGAEYGILRTLPDDCWPRIKKIALEFHHGAEELAGILKKHGFRVIYPQLRSERTTRGLLFAVREV